MAERRDKWYNSKEAAEYLNISVGHLQRLCRQGQIAHRRLKGYQFSKDMLDAFLRSRTVFQPQHPDWKKVRKGRPLDVHRGR
jgi:excisionase family DNA binding protein